MKMFSPKYGPYLSYKHLFPPFISQKRNIIFHGPNADTFGLTNYPKPHMKHKCQPLPNSPLLYPDGLTTFPIPPSPPPNKNSSQNKTHYFYTYR